MSEKFTEQLRKAGKVAEVKLKYCKDEEWRMVWILDHTSCHTAMPDSILDVTKMNLNPSSKQGVMMQDGWWGVGGLS